MKEKNISIQTGQVGLRGDGRTEELSTDCSRVQPRTWVVEV